MDSEAATLHWNSSNANSSHKNFIKLELEDSSETTNKKIALLSIHSEANPSKNMSWPQKTNPDSQSKQVAQSVAQAERGSCEDQTEIGPEDLEVAESVPHLEIDGEESKKSFVHFGHTPRRESKPEKQESIDQMPPISFEGPRRDRISTDLEFYYNPRLLSLIQSQGNGIEFEKQLETLIDEINDLISYFKFRNYQSTDLYASKLGMLFSQMLDYFVFIHLELNYSCREMIIQLRDILHGIDQKILTYYHDYQRSGRKKLQYNRAEEVVNAEGSSSHHPMMISEDAHTNCSDGYAVLNSKIYDFEAELKVLQQELKQEHSFVREQKKQLSELINDIKSVFRQ